MLRRTMETYSFMESVFVLQVIQRRRVILRCLTLSTATAAFDGLHALLLEGFYMLSADISLLRAEEASRG